VLRRGLAVGAGPAGQRHLCERHLERFVSIFFVVCVCAAPDVFEIAGAGRYGLGAGVVIFFKIFP
jgi:hypothetical protein